MNYAVTAFVKSIPLWYFVVSYFVVLAIVSGGRMWRAHIPLLLAGIARIVIGPGRADSPVSLVGLFVLCFVTVLSLFSNVPPIGETRKNMLGQGYTSFEGWSFKEWWSRDWW